MTCVDDTDQRTALKRSIATAICPACGCSLVRLGIRKEAAPSLMHDGDRHWFCCQGCVDLFRLDPPRALGETEDLIVCPTCLAEKPRAASVAVTMGDLEFRFCRCPACVSAFWRNPEFYVGRLEGTLSGEHAAGRALCCDRPV